MKRHFQLISIFIFLTFILTACGASAVLLEKPLAEKMPESNQQTKQGEKKTLPAAAKISDVPLINQMDDPRLYNGCEVTSMAMIFNYHGMDVTKNELADKIKRVPLTYRNNLKGNPHDGFVGDMKNGPGLSVYHEPMQELAAQYVGTRAVDISGSPVRELYRYIAEGLPVWIITTSNLAPVDNFEKWKTPSGEIDVSFNVHSVTVTGYDKDAVYVNNPYGQKNQKVDKKDFEAAWKQMGSQAIVITN